MSKEAAREELERLLRDLFNKDSEPDTPGLKRLLDLSARERINWVASLASVARQVAAALTHDQDTFLLALRKIGELRVGDAVEVRIREVRDIWPPPQPQAAGGQDRWGALFPGNKPFVNCEPLKKSLDEMAKASAHRRAVVVFGERWTGKSWTQHYLRQIAGAELSIYDLADFTEDHAYQDLCDRVCEKLAIAKVELRGKESTYSSGLNDLRNNLRQMGQGPLRWFFLDSADRVLPTRLEDLVIALIETINNNPVPARLVVAGQLSREPDDFKWTVEREELKGLLRSEVQTWLQAVCAFKNHNAPNFVQELDALFPDANRPLAEQGAHARLFQLLHQQGAWP